MTLETPIESEAAETSEALTISEATSFSDYERIRRGESVPKAQPAKPSAPGAEKAPEQNKSEESETSETEEKEESEGEESDEETGPKETEKPKKKSGIQRRVDKLNARVTAAQQDAEFWRRRASELATAPKEAPKAESAKPKATDSEPNADDYDNHADFVKAVARWEAKQELKADAQKQELKKTETEQREKAKTFQDRLSAFKAKTPDFDEVDSDLTEVLESSGQKISPVLSDIFMSSENGPELAYALAKDPDEFVRLCKLGPVAAAREIGKLEARLSAASSAEKKTETKKTTKASEPLKPVKASGKGAVAKSIGDPDLSFAEYERIRSEQLRQRRR